MLNFDNTQLLMFNKYFFKTNKPVFSLASLMADFVHSFYGTTRRHCIDNVQCHPFAITGFGQLHS